MYKKYFREVVYLKLYLFIIGLAIGLSYCVYYLFDPETVIYLGSEDRFFEWSTAISLFLASGISLYLFIKTKTIFYILLSIVYLFGGGEEISWGQRIFGFNAPEVIAKNNIQNEFSIHNLEIFDTHDFQNNEKKGFARLLEINFLFRLFIMIYGIILPLSVYHIKVIRKLTQWVRLPIPPIAIGIFFFVNWFVFWLLHSCFLSHQFGYQYLSAAGEIFECLSAFILLVISIYFLNNRSIIVYGQDIKNYLFKE